MMNTAFLIKIMMSGKLLLANCVLFLILNVLDGWTTWLVMKPDHYERERNPIARWVFRKLKLPYAIVLFKCLILGFLGVFVSAWWSEALTLNTGLLTGNLLFIFVVRHNYRVHRKYLDHEQRLHRLLNFTVTPD